MIFIVRHGETEKNKSHVLQGRSDLPLNETGILQAEEVKRRFTEAGIQFDKVYASPLTRALETAKIIAENVFTVVDERLIEMDYGPYEGSDLKDPTPELLAFFRDFVHNPAPEGMEPLSSVVSRLKSFLEEIHDEAETKNVLISTHAIAMKGALEYLMPESEGSWWSRYIGNCTVYVSEAEKGGTFSEPKPW